MLKNGYSEAKPSQALHCERAEGTHCTGGAALAVQKAVAKESGASDQFGLAP